MGISVVKKVAPYGIFVWKLDNGKLFGDSDGNVMNIPGRSHDISAMNKLTQAAKYYGAPEGKAVFLAGTQRVSNMRHSEEIDRMKEGLVPSETDIDMWKEQEDLFEEYKRQGWDWE